MSTQNICNICGANYEYRNGRWKCPACGAYKAEELSNEEVTLFYNAAQKLRLCDFDEAEKAYTDIIEKFPKNANGYWGRLLSRYGIKYEEDFDGRKIPTCYAASIESVLSDKDYHKALELADADTKSYFEQQAQYIERVRKEWIERAKKEKPYDIFICYKDSDLANGINRTQDSIAAQDLYIHLTEQGYRVFFSRESLRDKVGEKYEPYIFNALSTAKVMLVYGTSSEYITSTWLKNEWTRYEKRLQAGEKKPNSLIVACDGFSPAELPKALSSMQCFDATKRSFYTDLDVVLKKIIKGEGKPKPVTKENKEKKKSKKLPVAIATISALIAVFLCILIPNLLNTQPVTSIVDSKYGVVLTAQEGVFDKNTTVSVERLSDGTQYESLVSAVNDSKSIELQNAVIYDINCDADIDTNVTVKVSYAKNKADSTVKVYYVSDDKATVEEHSCTYDNGSVEFKTTHFSYYVVGEIVTENDDSSDNQDGNNDNQTIIERIGIRTITFSDKFTAEYALAQWESGEKTEKSMIAIMDRYGEQQGGGKLHIITPGEFIEEVDTWCFSFERKVGDYAIIENAYGYSLCYISSINPTDTEIEDDSEDGTGDDVTPIPPEVKETTIKFDANGGNGSMSEQTITVGESSNLKECSYTKSGYTFSGWATTTDGAVVYTDSGAFVTESEAEITLYAIWVPNTNSLVFNSNGGSGVMDTISIKTDETITLPVNTFSKTGYTFIGWSNVQSGSVIYTDGQFFTMTSSATATLYAIWEFVPIEEVKYTVKHFLQTNDGTGYKLDDTEELYAVPETTVSPAVNNYTGFISPIVQSNEVKTDGTLVIKYYYNRQTYSITFVSNGGTDVSQFSGLYGSNIGTIATPHKDNVTFNDWFVDKELTEKFTLLTVPAQNITVYAGYNEELSISDFTIEEKTTITLVKYNGNSKNCVIPSHFGGIPITCIGANCFDGNTTIETLTIPKTITTISSYAFSNCSKLAKVNSNINGMLIIPSSVTEIYEFAFQGLVAIEDVCIPNSVTHIGNGVLKGCDSIKKLSIPFVGCRKNIDGCLEWDEPQIGSYGSSNSELPVTREQYTNKLGHIFGYAGDYASGKPNGVIVQGEYSRVNGSVGDPIIAYYGFCFYIPDSLEEVVITNQSEVPACSFQNCNNLKKVTFTNGITKIGDEAFLNCDALISMVLDKTVNYVGWAAFQGCSSLTLYIEFSSYEDAIVSGLWDEHWCDSSVDVMWGTEYFTEGLTFVQNSDGYSVSSYSGSDENVIIPNTYNGLPVTTIKENAFSFNPCMKSIYIPQNVSVIAEYAFNNCTALESVIGADGMLTIGQGAFSDCAKLSTLPEFNSVQTIGNYAFRNCTSLQKFEMSNTVNTLGYEAFRGCSSLEEMIISSNLKVIDNKTFYGCVSLKNITIPQSINVIKSEAFLECSSLVSVYFEYQGMWLSSVDGANGGMEADVTNQYLNAQSLKNSASWGGLSLKKY